MLNTLTRRRSDRAARRNPHTKGFQNRSLPYAGFAGNKDELAGTLHRKLVCLEHVLDDRVTANDRQVCTNRKAQRDGFRMVLQSETGFATEPVASSMESLDELRFSRLI